MKFIVDQLYLLAATSDDLDQLLEIIAYGDKHLGNGTAADPQLVEDLVQIATARVEALRKAQA